MKPDYYKEIEYWKKYLPFLPKKYQDSYEIPDESYWDWNNEKIHFDYKFKKSNETSVILIHGAGGNGRILSLFGSYLSTNGINYYAPDNLGYGLTKLSNENFEYKDWVNMISDFTHYIIQKDKKPIILIGMSIGGMLAYQVATKVQQVRGLIVTTLADPRDKKTMIAMARNNFLGTAGLSVTKRFKLISDNIWLPIKWLCKINLMSRDPKFSKIFMEDRYAGGVNISMRFLRTFSIYHPNKEFEDFETCPILLIHPEKDDWTPFELSKRVFDKLNVQKEFYLLKDCGHVPIEEPGIYEMQNHILNFIKKKASS